MSEFCSINILCESPNGKIYTCDSCAEKVVFCYKNITQSMCKKYFNKFSKNVFNLNPKAFFKDFPFEKRIHIRTEWNALFYSFTKKEILESQILLKQADFKLNLFDRYALYLN